MEAARVAYEATLSKRERLKLARKRHRDALDAKRREEEREANRRHRKARSALGRLASAISKPTARSRRLAALRAQVEGQ